MSTKRNRSVNWDDEEKDLFRNILKDYTQIIEDKTLSTNMNKLKAKAWEEVCQKFNSLNRRQRELIQLKIQWKGMKINVRKSRGTFKEINKTVGGERPSTPDVALNEMLIPELTMDRNRHDSDGIIRIPAPMVLNNIRNSGFQARKDSNDDSEEFKDKESVRRMEIAEEKHAMEMEILKFKHKCIEEKHEMEMKILKLEYQITEEKLRSAKKQN